MYLGTRDSRSTCGEFGTKLRGIDHIVLTVAWIEATVGFFRDVLGFVPRNFGKGGRLALHCGNQKTNLHRQESKYQPHAPMPTLGSPDCCLIYDGSVNKIVARLTAISIKVEEGPVARTGAAGELKSVYVRDLDCNLVEIAVFD